MKVLQIIRQKNRFYKIIEKYRVNKLFTAPTALRMLKSLGDEELKKHDLSCLDVISLVGEPFDPETWHWTYEKLGKKKKFILIIRGDRQKQQVHH